MSAQAWAEGPVEAIGATIPAPEDPEARAAGRWLRRVVGAGALDLPLPGSGHTWRRFATLAELAAGDPVHARLAEGHVDALAILTELGDPVSTGVWGVWAAAPATVQARPGRDGWRLTGQRAWCSGAWACTDALVTAQAPDGIRLFAVRTNAPGLSAVPGSWPAVGMAASDTRTVTFADVAAQPVGAPGAYTSRPGFWHGGIGVAACWYGGAVGVGRRLLHQARATGPADPHLLAHLGGVESALGAAADSLLTAAGVIDADPTRRLPRLAARVRAGVEAAATEVLDRVGRACGAEPLGHDPAHAKRVADLTVYLRQSHAERDLATLGSRVAEESTPTNAWLLTDPHAVAR